MKLFEVQTNSLSYVYPITKIILSAAIILICIFRRKLFNIPEGVIDGLASIISFALVLLCILILYISFGEIFHTYSNRQQRVSDLDDAVQVPVGEVVKIVKRDDIVELEVLTERGIVKVGSSSDNAYCESVFFAKKYYIGSHGFDSIEGFENELFSLSENGFLNVFSIDGLRARKHLQ